MHRRSPKRPHFCTGEAQTGSNSAPRWPKGRVFLRRRELAEGLGDLRPCAPCRAHGAPCESVSSFRLYIGEAGNGIGLPSILSRISTIPLDVHRTRANMEACSQFD